MIYTEISLQRIVEMKGCVQVVWIHRKTGLFDFAQCIGWLASHQVLGEAII